MKPAALIFVTPLLAALIACGGGGDGTDENGRCVENGEVVSQEPCPADLVPAPAPNHQCRDVSCQ